ncbi:hypothetical protein ACWA1F_07310 [Flavobacterium sp. 3-218]
MMKKIFIIAIFICPFFIVFSKKYKYNEDPFQIAFIKEISQINYYLGVVVQQMDYVRSS